MRLATFNILHGRSPADGRVDVDRLRAACRSLDPDVLALQEVDRDQDRSHSADLAAAVADAIGACDWRFAPALVGTPGAAWRRAHGPPGAGEPSYGVALLSRYPVRAWHVVALPAAPLRVPVTVPGTRRLVLVDDEPRVAVVGLLDAPWGPLTVATTHLSFVRGWNARQLRVLVRALRAFPEPRVLLGDLNLTPRMARLASGWRALATEPTYPAAAPRLRIDQVLGDGPLPPVRTTRAVELPVSDHRALVVDVEDAA